MKKIDSSLFTVFMGAELANTHNILGGIYKSYISGSSDPNRVGTWDKSDNGSTWSSSTQTEDTWDRGTGNAS